MMVKGTITACALMLTVLLAELPIPADAEERLVRLDGRVQWVAGQAMAVQLDTGGSVSIDLVRVPQDQYATMSLNERVTVLGVITDGNRRVTGTSIFRGDNRQAP